MNIGIYMIKNLFNNKVYIGQSTNIDRRWNDHKNKLNNNKHENLHLQESYNKYGEDNFSFEIICKCGKDELNDKEVYYINKFKSYMPENGYNLTKGGNSNIAFTESTIEKMRNSHEYEFVSILQYSTRKEFIKRYNSISEASREINGTPSGIRNCANKFSFDIGASKTYKGFIWIYEFEKERFEDYNIEKYLKREFSIPINKYQYPSGKFICRYDTVLLAATDNNVSNDVISMCVRGVQKQSNGFTYRNANEFLQEDIQIEIVKQKCKTSKKVVGLDPIANKPILFLHSMNELKDKGFHSGHICECCNGKRKTYKGYVWKYTDEQFEKYFSEDGIKQVKQKSLSDI